MRLRTRLGVGWTLGALVIAGLSIVATAVGGAEAFSPWNPALGVGAGLVMAGGAAFVVPVLAGQLAGAWWLGWVTPIGAGAGAVVASMLAPVLLGFAVRRFVRADPAGWSVREVGALVAVALGAGVAIGAVALALAPPAALHVASTAYFRAGVGAAAGVMLGLPAVAGLTVALRAGRAELLARLRNVGAGEIATHAALTLGVGAAAYVLQGPTGERFWSLYFLPLLWTAFRCGMPGVVAALVLVSVQAIVLAMALRTPLTTLTNFHFFLFNFSATALLLAAALGARRAAERARGRSEALLAGAFRVSHDALVLFRRADGAMLDVNWAWTELVGRARDELLGRSLFTLPEWSADTGAGLRRVAHGDGAVQELEGEVRRPAGAVRLVRVMVEMVTVDTDTYGVAFVRDVTESRLVERQRLQSQKLEAVGLLAGGVAHDFNNILAAIAAGGELLRSAIPDDDDRRVDVDAILDGARRGAELTRQLLAFSRQHPDVPPRPIEAAAVIRGMTTMLARLLGSEIRVVTQLGAGPVTVLAAPGQLEQVVLNLIVNARDAMGRRGTLVIEAAECVVPEAAFVPEVGCCIAAGPWAVIRVRDDGEGIDPAVLTRIFEPFFTTKPEERGTGLGLSTVYGIMRSVGGHVGVQSTVGEGTTFALYWPGRAA